MHPPYPDKSSWDMNFQIRIREIYRNSKREVDPITVVIRDEAFIFHANTTPSGSPRITTPGAHSYVGRCSPAIGVSGRHSPEVRAGTICPDPFALAFRCPGFDVLL